MSAFTDMLAAGYASDEPALTLGAALDASQVYREPKIRLPLAMANRHGLIAGATGTGRPGRFSCLPSSSPTRESRCSWRI
jgi:DNA helicase HerA-like ATPase